MLTKTCNLTADAVPAASVVRCAAPHLNNLFALWCHNRAIAKNDFCVRLPAQQTLPARFEAQLDWIFCMTDSSIALQEDELTEKLIDNLRQAIEIADRLGYAIAAIHIQNAIELIAEREAG